MLHEWFGSSGRRLPTTHVPVCPVDLRKLAHLCGFDVVSRYEGLRGFFDALKLRDEVAWIDERLSFIKGEGE